MVDGENYFWYRRHFHRKPYELSPCVEIFTVYLQDAKRGPLRIHFKEDDNKLRADSDGIWHAGYPQSGVLWLSLPDSAESAEFNLNRPKVAAALIRLARETHWNPTAANGPLEIEKGFDFLDEHCQTLLDRIDPSGTETRPLRNGYGFPVKRT